MRYTKVTAYNGFRESEEIVDEQHLARFTSPETLAFFRGLGGTEKVTVKDGVTRVVSTRPDGKVQRVTTFTPLDES